jgi:hypothetical protein
MSLKLVSLMISVVVCGTMLEAQDATGQIHGTVQDASGGLAPGAQVTITETRTGAVRKLNTNESGNYYSPKLRTGVYTVEVEKAGFAKHQQTGIVLGAGANAEVNVVLQVGNITQTVTITENAPLLNTTSGASRTSIDSIFIERVPLNGRDSNEMLKLVPGAVLPLGRGGGPASATEYSVNGIRSTSNNFTLDGTDNSDSFNSNGSRLPSPDALQEFTVQSNYSAEFGYGAGVAVTAITRSGTNSLHGSLYDYYQTDTLNANSFQNNASGLPKPAYARHRLGFTVGGPVLFPKIYDGRNKTFFFFNYQLLKTPASPYLWRRGGLTQAELNGDFSQSKIIPTVSSAAAAAPNSPFAGMAGSKITDLKPYLSQTALSWYKYFQIPVVETSGAFAFTQETQSLSQPEFTTRLDHAITSKNNISFSMFWRHDSPETRQINDAPASFTSVDTFRNQHYSMSDVWVLTPALVNELSLGYNRLWDNRLAGFGDTDFSKLGFPFPQPDPHGFIQTNTLSPSFFSFNGQNFKYEGRDALDMRDTVSIVHGNHFMKAGARVALQNTNAKLSNDNEYRYNGGWLGNQAAEFLIGWPATLCCASEPFYRNARKDITNIFFLDDWKVAPRLTLNLGIRWEPQFWSYLKNDKGLLFIPGAQSQLFPNFPSGVIPVNDPQSPSRSGRSPDWNNIAPRVGLAYRLDSAGTKVIRGGYGIFYDSTDTQRDGITLTSAFPFNQSYNATFDRGYPGPEGWLNIFAYQQLPMPDFSQPANPANAIFDPKGTYGTYLPDNKLGYVQQWNVTFEHEFRPGWSYSAAYLGNRGVNLMGIGYWNVPQATGAGDNWNLENVAARRPIQDYRYQTRSYFASNANSRYNAMRFTFRARARDLHLLAHYTYSSTRSDIDGIWGTYNRSNPTDLSVDWAQSNIDRPNNFLTLVTWDLPLLRHSNSFISRMLGGWQATSILQMISGSPVNVVAAQNNTFVCSACTIRPDLTGQPLINSDWRSDPNLKYVNPAAFSQPKDGTFGNAPRNAIRWPYTKNVDLNFAKDFRPLERLTVEVRAEFYNLFNWVNFTPPSAVNLGSPLSLTMKNSWTAAPRNSQLGFRLVF